MTNRAWFCIFLLSLYSLSGLPAEGGKTAEDSALKQANACFRDPTCPLETAKTAYLKAAKQEDPEVNCFYFYEGIGVDKDFSMAFHCFERSVNGKNGACGGGSPSLDRIYYAAMVMEGKGTKSAPQRVAKIFDGCLEDSSVQAMKAEALKRAEGKMANPLSFDFCKDIGGTTISMQECSAIANQKAEMAGFLEEKGLIGTLDPRARDRYKSLVVAWDDFVKKSADFYSDQYRGGTIRNQIYSNYVAKKKNEWAKSLSRLKSYRPKDEVSRDDFAAAEKKLNDYYRKALASAGDAEAQKLLKQAELAWITYRDEAVTFFRAAYGKRFGDEKVELDTKMKLTTDRASDLRPRKK